MALIQKTLMRFMRKLLINKDISIDELGKNNRADQIFDEFTKASANIMNVTKVKNFINLKDQKVDKNEI